MQCGILDVILEQEKVISRKTRGNPNKAIA